MLDGITSNLPLWAPFLTVSLQLTKTDFRLLFHIFFSGVKQNLKVRLCLQALATA